MHARGKSGCVDKRLHRRSDLPLREISAVEFARGVVAAADQDADAAVVVVDRHGGGLKVGGAPAALRVDIIGVGFLFVRVTRARLHGGQLFVDRGHRGALHRAVQRGVNFQARAVDDVLRQDTLQFPPKKFHRPILLRGLGSFRGKEQRFRLGRLAVGGGNVALLFHLPQHDVALLQGAVRIPERRKAVRTTDETGEQGGFGKGQVGGRLAEVGLARGFDAEQPGTEINPVHVVREDFIFAQHGFHAHGKRCFEHFAVHVLAAEREAVTGQLLGEGAAALTDTAGAQIGHRRPGDAEGIDAEVLQEARIFPRDDGADEPRADAIQRDRAPVLARQTGVNFPVAVDNERTFRNAADFPEIEGPGPGKVETRDEPPEQEGGDDQTSQLARAVSTHAALFRAQSQQADAMGRRMAGGGSFSRHGTDGPYHFSSSRRWKIRFPTACGPDSLVAL